MKGFAYPYSGLGYTGLRYSGLGYSELGYAGHGYAGLGYGYGHRYGGLGYAGLGYSGLGLGYGLGYPYDYTLLPTKLATAARELQGKLAAIEASPDVTTVVVSNFPKVVVNLHRCVK